MSVHDLPVTSVARVREALRRHLGENADVEGWLVRWMCSCASTGEHVRRELEEVIPPSAHWLIAYVDVDAVARDWSDCNRVVYACDRLDIVHVFENERAHELDPAAKR